MPRPAPETTPEGLSLLSHTLRTARRKAGYTSQQALADAAGVSINSLNPMEAGRALSGRQVREAIETTLELRPGVLADIAAGRDPGGFDSEARVQFLFDELNALLDRVNAIQTELTVMVNKLAAQQTSR